MSTQKRYAVMLTIAELRQLRAIVSSHHDTGDYWGNRERHYDRTRRLLACIDAAHDGAEEQA